MRDIRDMKQSLLCSSFLSFQSFLSFLSLESLESFRSFGLSIENSPSPLME